MKKKIAFFLVFLILTLIGWLAWQSVSELKTRQARSDSISSIPPLRIVDQYGQSHYLPEIKAKTKSFLLVLFNSECEFCQHEGEAIFENLVAFKETQIVFVSDEPIESINAFASKYFPGESNVLFAKTTAENIANIFGTVTYPNLLLYNVDGILIKEYKGEVEIETILRAIE